MQPNRHRDSLTIFVGAAVIVALLIFGVVVLHLGGEPGLPPCPRTAGTQPTTVVCH